jgi:anti-sigma B factor antagonist
MAQRCQHVVTRREDDVLIVAFARPQVLDPDYIDLVRDELLRVMAQADPPMVVIDFECVHFLSSSAVGLILRLDHEAKQRGGALCIANVRREVFEVFRLTKLDSLIRACETTDAAVRSVREATERSTPT